MEVHEVSAQNLCKKSNNKLVFVFCFHQLQWHPSKEHVFCSGSYDESVRVWDARNMSLPVKEVPTGGGVWRVKWTRSGSRIIAASMHGECCLLLTLPTSLIHFAHLPRLPPISFSPLSPPLLFSPLLSPFLALFISSLHFPHNFINGLPCLRIRF